MLAIGVAKTALAGGNPTPVVTPPHQPMAATAVGFWVLMRTFASGCTAITGVEAVSNGVGAFRAPAVPHARPLTAIMVLLAVLLAGIAYTYARLT